MHFPRMAVTATAVALGVLSASEAAADDDDQRQPYVAWDAPDGCPDRETFEAQLHEHLGDKEPGQPMHVEVRIERRGRALRLTMRTRTKDGDGERTLSGRDCAVLTETAALTLALAISPDAVPEETRRAFGISDDEVPGSVNRGAGVVTTAAPRPRERSLDMAVRAFSAADRGSLPGLAPGIGGAVGVRLRRWRVEGLAEYWFQRDAADPADSSRIIALSTILAGLRGCYRPFERGRVELDLCAGAATLRTTGRGMDLGDPPTGTWSWFAVFGGPAMSFRVVEHLYFRVDVEMNGRPYDRPKFGSSNGMDGIETLFFKPTWVGIRGSAGLEARFP